MMDLVRELPEVRPMEDLEKAPRPRRITDDQWRSILAGLEPGWYTSSMLYPRYVAWVPSGSSPISRVAFGHCVSAFVGKGSENSVVLSGCNGVRRYRLTTEHVSGPAVG